MKKKPNPILHSFPVQLLFTHARRNLALLSVWIILFAAMSGNMGKVYGIQYLFLDPEYLGAVNFWSFFIIGLTFGQITMAFHVASYILDSHRFTFLGLMERPFARFALNNSVIPFFILIYYLVAVVKFQVRSEFQDWLKIAEYVGGLTSGVVSMLIVSFYYFKFTNTDIVRLVTKKVDMKLRKSGLSRDRMMKKLKESRRDQERFLVHNYFDLDLGVRRTNRLSHVYDKDAILKVFDQNHMNSVLIGLSLIITLVLLGGFIENPILQIPAGSSVMLMLTVVIILLGAVIYWFRGWGLPFIVLLFFLVNAGVKSEYIKGAHEAKGMDYTVEPAEYSIAKLREVNSADVYRADMLEQIKVLNYWKAQQTENKPKMILLCVSGGGQRAALWTMTALQKADSALDGQLLRKSALITGASGGMIGAAYYRELYLRMLEGDISPNDPVFLERIAKDNLNPVVFSMLVNDAFMSFRKYTYAGHAYTKDRGYAFEHNLNRNINNVLDKRLMDYVEPERRGRIPTLLLSPTVANDGRKLHITTRPFSFMNTEERPRENSKLRGVDFLRLFEDQGAKDLSFMTALRMSASFPYITPTIALPSKPRLEVMDAGIADNFGVADALRFMYVFRDWIHRNTSGVVMVIIRDTHPNEHIQERPIPSLIDRLTYPVASVYNNLGSIQDRNNDVRIEQAREWFRGDFETVEFIYGTSGDSEQERASLSWHLTTKEKQSVIGSIDSPENKKALSYLRALAHSE